VVTSTAFHSHAGYGNALHHELSQQSFVQGHLVISTSLVMHVCSASASGGEAIEGIRYECLEMTVMRQRASYRCAFDAQSKIVDLLGK
jgi:hypothetical protein